MKRTLLLAFALLFLIISANAQYKKGNKPGIRLRPDPGYITYNELNSGLGLGVTSDAYSKGFFGFTTIHGYQVNQTFSVAGGTGISFYNEGTLLPLFMDLRLRFLVSRFTPYVFGDGGFLFDFVSVENTRIFANPGIGCYYATSRNLAINLGVGIHSQFRDTRASYVNIKLGITFKPN
jgi:hypothetical protein